MTRESTMGRFFALRPHLVPSLIAAGFCLGAMGRWPYGYYILLRWVVCAAAVFVVVLAVLYKKHRAAWPFGVVAVAFNPLIPIHLTREIWRVVDVAVAAAFIAVITVLCRPKRSASAPETEI